MPMNLKHLFQLYDLELPIYLTRLSRERWEKRTLGILEITGKFAEKTRHLKEKHG
jgi:hypothetical protein